jgi:wyosine [tRNA(Phe)-imidazoG37] synthetase (radical SAM superfamily)
MTENHIFGPVMSRRLGRSLGIDLLPFKTCSYNCVYCECGATTHLTTKRAEFFPTEEVISQLDKILSNGPTLDYITFAGSGEPTLSLSIGKIIRHLKTTYPQYKVAVLTNGSLLGNEEGRSGYPYPDQHIAGNI